LKKNWREREMTMEIVVGTFMVMILLGLGYFTIILSKESFFQEKHELMVMFEDVRGLRVGDNVFLRGMPVGKVKSLQLDCAKSCRGVQVTLNLDMPVALREGYEFRIVPTTLLGGLQLQILEGRADGPVVEKEVYIGAPPHDLMGHAAEIVAAARKEIIEGDVFGRLRSVVTQVDEMVTRVNAGQGIVGKLLSDDDTVYKDIAAVAAGAREIVEGLTSGEGMAGRLLAEDSNAVFEDLEAIVKGLRNVVDKVERGEGTIGKLLAEDTIYAEIEATIQEVRAAVDDFRETAPITTFSSIFFGAF
jgi:phospholipid/cholesterol/gamma-HCH transport system substrate-binding protein